MKPLAVDLYCGLGGWTEGLVAEGYRVVGFDVERHDYGEGKRYPAQLVLQDVLTLHGRQFKGASLIVASPPCQEFSYMAMPWSRAKAIAAEYRSGKRDMNKLTALFDACFRIQREAIEAAGHFIPLVVENVRGAQAWVGRARWNFGSFYLWGDVPALMPITMRRAVMKQGIAHRANGETNFHGAKNNGGSWFNIGSPGQKETNRNPVHELARACGQKTVGHVNQRDGYSHTRHPTNQAESDGIKHGGDCFNDPSWAGKQGGTRCQGPDGVKFSQTGPAWFDGTPRDKMLGEKGPAAFGSKSNARKAASAQIAKIPLPLARWIARVYKPSPLSRYIPF